MLNEENTVFPFRPGYRRADRANDYQPSRVAARAITTDGTVVERAHSAVVHAGNEFQKHVDAVQRDRHHYSPDGFRSQITRFGDTDAARAVDKAVEQVRARREQAQNELDKIRADLTPDGDTAAELRANRYWNRTKAVLDTLDSGHLLRSAQDLVAKAGTAELGTLLQELGPYFASRGKTTEWIEPTVAQVVPEFGRAREQLTKADQALQVTEFNAKALRRGVHEGRPPTALASPHRYDPDT